MPATCSRRARGIMPIGDSVPCGVSTETESPTDDAELRREVGAEQDRAGAVGLRRRRARRATPLRIAAEIAVTCGSSAGSMPLRLMNAWSPAAETSALPRMAGAAPITCGTRRSCSASVR